MAVIESEQLLIFTERNKIEYRAMISYFSLEKKRNDEIYIKRNGLWTFDINNKTLDSWI